MIFRALFAAAMAISSQSIFAGQFNVQCYSGVDDCGSKIKDIVTEKFMQRFPFSRFSIVIISEVQKYNDGGVGYAVAGVSPRGSGQVPFKRWNATFRIVNQPLNGYDVMKENIETMRSAVSELMAACENSSNCDVYTPYK